MICGPAQAAALQCLTDLRILQLRNGHLPAGLEQLTSLRVLLLEAHSLVRPQDVAAFKEALPRLSNLLHLDLRELPPPVAEALPRCALRTFSFVPRTAGAAVPAALPAGPWLAALTCLAAPAALLHASLQHLPAAAQLERMAVLDADSCTDGLPAIINWAVGHAPLRLLFVQSKQPLPHEAWQCVLEGQRRRPELCIKPCTDAPAATPALQLLRS